MAKAGRKKASSGPGRGKPRTWAASRPSPHTGVGTGLSPRSSSAANAVPPEKRVAKGFYLTRRAIVLLAIIAALGLTYANSLRVYFHQQMQIAEAKAEVAARQDNIEKLRDEIARWEDRDYVRAQARSRLGWVLPGEVGYRVIGPDGQLIGDGVTIATTGDNPGSVQTWWQKLWVSLEVADSPDRGLEPGAEPNQPTPKPTP